MNREKADGGMRLVYCSIDWQVETEVYEWLTGATPTAAQTYNKYVTHQKEH